MSCRDSLAYELLHVAVKRSRERLALVEFTTANNGDLASTIGSFHPFGHKWNHNYVFLYVHEVL